MMRGKFTPHFYSGGRLCQKRKLVKISIFHQEEKEFKKDTLKAAKIKNRENSI